MNFWKEFGKKLEKKITLAFKEKSFLFFMNQCFKKKIEMEWLQMDEIKTLLFRELNKKPRSKNENNKNK